MESTLNMYENIKRIEYDFLKNKLFALFPCHTSSFLDHTCPFGNFQLTWMVGHTSNGRFMDNLEQFWTIVDDCG